MHCCTVPLYRPTQRCSGVEGSLHLIRETKTRPGRVSIELYTTIKVLYVVRRIAFKVSLLGSVYVFSIRRNATTEQHHTSKYDIIYHSINLPLARYFNGTLTGIVGWAFASDFTASFAEELSSFSRRRFPFEVVLLTGSPFAAWPTKKAERRGCVAPSTVFVCLPPLVPRLVSSAASALRRNVSAVLEHELHGSVSQL